MRTVYYVLRLNICIHNISAPLIKLLFLTSTNPLCTIKSLNIFKTKCIVYGICYKRKHNFHIELWASWSLNFYSRKSFAWLSFNEIRFELFDKTLPVLIEYFWTFLVAFQNDRNNFEFSTFSAILFISPLRLSLQNSIIPT